MSYPTTTLEQLKEQLNQAKDALNITQFNQLKRKHYHDKWIRQLRKRVTQTGNAQYVTKAWLKMYEILSVPLKGDIEIPLGEFLPTQTKAFFNAELPGGFIFATNHYLKTHGKELEWVVASYLPRDEIGDYLKDQFGLLQANPNKSLVGRVKTTRGVFWSNGDLTDPKMPSILAQLAGPNTIDLYTADGGFDVTGQENIQEELSLPLIRGEIEAGLKSLAPDGSFVLKLFTFFTPQMWSYLLTLMRAFRQYQIYKPMTSNPINSEVYFVGIGYKGGRDLHDNYEEILQSITPEEADFLQTRLFELTKNQISAINAFLQGEQQVNPFVEGSTFEIIPLNERDQIPTAGI
jgi:hypothetical protein